MTRRSQKGGTSGKKADPPKSSFSSTRAFSSSHAVWWVLAAALLVNLPVLDVGYVLDDHEIVERNARVQEGELLPLWTGSYWEKPGETAEYRPLTLTSYVLENRLLGSSPFHFHFVNWLLHALVCGVVLAAGRAIGFREPIAVAGALVFAVHPIHVDVVAPIVGRAELFAGLGYLVPLILWIRIRRSPTRDVPGLALLCGFVALGAFSKENALAVVPLLVVVELLVVRLAAPRSSLLTGGGVVAGVIVVYLVARVLALGALVPAEGSSVIEPLENPLVDETLGVRLLTAASLLGTYLRLFLWPVGLSPDYSAESLPVIRSAIRPAFWIPVLLTAAAASLAARRWRTRPTLAIALVTFLAPYSIVSNAPFLIGTMLAERLLYLPSVGLAWGIATAGVALVERFVPALRPDGVRALLAVPILALGFFSLERSNLWRDEAELYRRAAQIHPKNFLLRRNLGSLALEAKRYDEARYHMDLLTEIAPDYAKGWGDRGFLHLLKGNAAEALPMLERSVALDDGNPVPLENLAHAYEQLGRREDARRTQARAETVRRELVGP